MALKTHLPTEMIEKALEPLAKIADAYDDNHLDEDRPEWGRSRDPKDIELFSGRGGRQLLTLHDCIVARDVLRWIKSK